MKFTIGCMVMALCVSVVLGDETSWQGTPDTVGDWFDPANWSAGVPTAGNAADVSGLGTAGISSGQAESQFLHLGLSGDGRIVQTGGSYSVGLYTHLGEGSYYSLIGGEFTSSHLIMRYSDSVFQQTGGLCRVDHLNVKQPMRLLNIEYTTPEGYELIGGQLETRREGIGTEGWGLFRQVGGVHNVERKLSVGGPYGSGGIIIIDPDLPSIVRLEPSFTRTDMIAMDQLVTSLYIPPPQPSSGRYELAGGILSSRELEIGRTGTFEQTGGVNNVGYLSIGSGGGWSSLISAVSGGEYRMLGGSLRIDMGLDMDFNSKLDLCGANVAVTGNGLLNFGKGSLLNTENASLSVGANSLTIFSGDFDPAARWGSFQSDGLVHFAGNDLVIAPGEGFSGWGKIDDHVESSGVITASEGGSIDLKGGLFVNAGSVDLGRGDLTVAYENSGIMQGELHAENMILQGSTITYYPEQPKSRGIFMQNGGETTLSEHLKILRNGIYELHGGELSVRRIDIGPNGSDSASFIQTGGTCNVEDVLYLGNSVSSYVGPMDFVLNASNNLADSLKVAPVIMESESSEEPSSMYLISGGRLTAGEIYLHALDADKRFIQTGGIVEVEKTVAIYDSRSSYAMHGGQLYTKELKIGSKYYFGTSSEGGNFAIMSQDAEVHVSETLSFGYPSQFISSPGATIHMDGASLFNYSTDSNALSGLGNLSLIFEGGDDYVATFEIAGEDRGIGYGGFFENFALDTLQIGGDEGAAHLQLVDLFDNQPDWEGSEALYVKELILGEGSTLDLNGLSLYSLNVYLDGTVDWNGGTIFEGITEADSTIWTGNFELATLVGDANHDGVVSMDDYASIQANLGSTGEPGLPGDANYDGAVSADDYASVQTNFGDTSGMGGDMPVPEPATLSLLAIGGLVMLRYRRK